MGLAHWKVPREGIADRCHRIVAGDQDAIREMILWASVETDRIVRDEATIACEDLLIASAAEDLVRGVEQVVAQKITEDREAIRVLLDTLRTGITDRARELDYELFDSMSKGMTPRFGQFLARAFAYLVAARLKEPDRSVFRIAYPYAREPRREERRTTPLVVEEKDWSAIADELARQGVKSSRGRCISVANAKQIWSRAWRLHILPNLGHLKALRAHLKSAEHPSVEEFMARWNVT